MNAPAFSLTDRIFREAHTAQAYQDRPVGEATLREIYDIAKWGPTSMNSQPGRFVFLTTPAAKERLAARSMAGNAEKIRRAPVTIIIAQDRKFYEHMPKLFPPIPAARDMFAGNADLATITAFRNSTLTGAYLLIAARALGLEVGPMSGFDNAAVDAEFFPEGRWASNFITTLGYADASANFPRNPRLDFDEAALIL